MQRVNSPYLSDSDCGVKMFSWSSVSVSNVSKKKRAKQKRVPAVRLSVKLRISANLMLMSSEWQSVKRERLPRRVANRFSGCFR